MSVRSTSGRETAERSASPRRDPGGFLIQDADGSCRECLACVRACPARAIRVVDGRSYVIQDRCVKCGLCVLECEKGGFTVRDDLSRVQELLDGPHPVVAVLASESVAALYPLSPLEVERTLLAIGFHSVESTLLGEEIVAEAYEQSLARSCGSLIVRSTCPVAVDWVRKYHPRLVPALAPVVPPYVAQARLVKTVYPEGTAVVYVSPCYARKDEAYDVQFDHVVDAAIDFTELERLLSARRRLPPYAVPCPGTRRPLPEKEISLTDGFPRKLVSAPDADRGGLAVVRGLRDFDELLMAISRGEAAPAVIDILNCEGCLDGPAVRPGMSVFAKRNVEIAEREKTPRVTGSRRLVRHLPEIDLIRSFVPDTVRRRRIEPAEVDAALAEGGFHSREEVLDCGACGYDTCVEHSTAIVEGHSSWERCFPAEKARMAEANEVLRATATTDSLTGLGNRRAFDEALAEETARSRRNGQSLSLLMIDIDGFKSLNDGYGHTVGDEVLSSIARTVCEHVRETDSANRYGGDEFGVLLPETAKTGAFLVAEKLREAIAGLSLMLDSDTGAKVPSVTASIGIATVAGQTADAGVLVEAADRALYQAKQSGRDQVRLAAG